MNTPAIRTEKLVRTFGKVEALKGVDLEIPRCSIYALLGPNGAGKSTALSILVNAIQPERGTATVLGTASTKLSAKDFTRIGYVAEHQELPDWMTGEQWLRFLQPLYPRWDAAFETQLRETLAVPISRRIGQMSRGEQMKVRLLSSMAYRPDLLILDEPFSGLDPLVREELSSGLLELVGGSDWTVILASHDVDELERLADRVGFLANGRLRFSETVESLQRRFRKVTARFADAPKLDAAGAAPGWQGLEYAGGEVRFTDDAYDEARCRERLGNLGELRHVEAHSLSLREIFVSASRRERGEVAK